MSYAICALRTAVIRIIHITPEEADALGIPRSTKVIGSAPVRKPKLAQIIVRDCLPDDPNYHFRD